MLQLLCMITGFSQRNRRSKKVIFYLFSELSLYRINLLWRLSHAYTGESGLNFPPRFLIPLNLPLAIPQSSRYFHHH